MKVGAHPLVVAVALGLVGPQVLEEIEPVNDRKPDTGCSEESLDDVAEPGALGAPLVTTTLGPTDDWSHAPAPSPADFARIALAFERARNLV